MEVVRSGEDSRIQIQCSPETVKDLITVLNNLLRLAEKMRSEMERREAQRKADDESVRLRQRAEFERFSRKIYLYMAGREKSGLSRPQAIQETKKAFGLGYYDVVLYHAAGRKIAKNGNGGHHE